MSRCKHSKWKIVARRFSPGVAKFNTAGGADINLIKELAFGFTMIEEVCCECNKTEFRKVSGDQTSG